MEPFLHGLEPGFHSGWIAVNLVGDSASFPALWRFAPGPSRAKAGSAMALRWLPFPSLLLLLLTTVLPSCSTTLSPGFSGGIVTRKECLAIAERYRVHPWKPTEQNIRHGRDGAGIQVDTPDCRFNPPGSIAGWWVPDQVNRGVPYQWGGFSTPEQFDKGLALGYAAGDVYTEAKRAALDHAVSRQAVGIDCSGFVSRCWKLRRSYSTRELPSLCRPVTSWPDLKPGDILNTHNAHVLLFAGWEDSGKARLIAYETGCPPDWKVIRHAIDVAWLRRLGYQAWRYRGMRD